MRPKKIILCVDDDEQNLSELAFVLHLAGYNVKKAANANEAIEFFAQFAVDLVLTDFRMPMTNGDVLVRQLKVIAPYVPMMVMADFKDVPADLVFAADAVLDKKRITAEEMLARVKQMSARKRGPRKGSTRAPRKPVSSVEPTSVSWNTEAAL